MSGARCSRPSCAWVRLAAADPLKCSNSLTPGGSLTHARHAGPEQQLRWDGSQADRQQLAGHACLAPRAKRVYDWVRAQAAAHAAAVNAAAAHAAAARAAAATATAQAPPEPSGANVAPASDKRAVAAVTPRVFVEAAHMMAQAWAECERTLHSHAAAGVADGWPTRIRPAVDADPAGAAAGLSETVATLVRVTAAGARLAALLSGLTHALPSPPPPPPLQDHTAPPPPPPAHAGMAAPPS